MQGLHTLQKMNAATTRVKDARLALRAEKTYEDYFVFSPDGYCFILHPDSVLPSGSHPAIEVEYLGQQTPIGADQSQAAFRVILHGTIHTGLTRQQAIDLVKKEEGVLIESLLNEYFNEA